MAKKAYLASAFTDIVDGSTHLESIDFPDPYWVKGATLTRHIGKHKFYKDVK